MPSIEVIGEPDIVEPHVGENYINGNPINGNPMEIRIDGYIGEQEEGCGNDHPNLPDPANVYIPNNLYDVPVRDVPNNDVPGHVIPGHVIPGHVAANRFIHHDAEEDNNDDNSHILHTYLSCLSVFLSLGLGITEAVILSNSTDAKNECGPAIWYCILTCCVVHFVSMYTTACSGKKSNTPGEKKCSNAMALASAMIMSIWSMVCYYNTDHECIHLFESKYSYLWTMVYAESIMFIIYLLLSGMACSILVCMLCIGGTDIHR